MWHMSHIMCQVYSVRCHMSPFHSTCYKVSKNINCVEYLIQICILISKGQISPPSSPTKFLDGQANRVEKELITCGSTHPNLLYHGTPDLNPKLIQMSYLNLTSSLSMTTFCRSPFLYVCSIRVTTVPMSVIYYSL